MIRQAVSWPSSRSASLSAASPPACPVSATLPSWPSKTQPVARTTVARRLQSGPPGRLPAVHALVAIIAVVTALAW